MEVLTTAIRQEIKGIRIGKKEVKLLQFADNMIPYIENSKDAPKKLLELLNELSKVAGYNINIQKSVVFLYNNNKLSNKIKKTISFYNLIKKYKIPRSKSKKVNICTWKTIRH